MSRSHLRRPVARLVTAFVIVVFAAAMQMACFSTYQVPRDEFAKLQTTEQVPRTIVDEDGTEVLVEDQTALYVRTEGGKRYPVTPFNFKMTQSQLVASDRDTLLALQEIDEYEVDLFNTGFTVLWIIAGVAVVGGIIAATVVTAGDRQLGGNN